MQIALSFNVLKHELDVTELTIWFKRYRGLKFLCYQFQTPFDKATKKHDRRGLSDYLNIVLPHTDLIIVIVDFRGIAEFLSKRGITSCLKPLQPGLGRQQLMEAMIVELPKLIEKMEKTFRETLGLINIQPIS